MTGAGLRAYLAVQGGLDVPAYLGSRSSFTLGQFGGHAGRTLAAGDVLHLAHMDGLGVDPALDPRLRPALTKTWTVRVLPGPHGAPDFFTPADIAMIESAQWQVHYNSNRTGVRLVGPKPEWARRDGGCARGAPGRSPPCRSPSRRGAAPARRCSPPGPPAPSPP